MRATTPALIALILLAGALPTSAEAQRLVAFDTVTESTPAALSCGFCGGEKFGMIFRELSGGGGLQASEFPLTINSLRIAVASANVTGDGFTTPLSCVGSSETGTVGDSPTGGDESHEGHDHEGDGEGEDDGDGGGRDGEPGAPGEPGQPRPTPPGNVPNRAPDIRRGGGEVIG